MIYTRILYITLSIGVILVAGLLLLTIVPIPGTNFDARVVQSGSMEPAIKTGSLILIRPAESYKIGDIVTFRHRINSTPTTHRIIDEKPGDGVWLFTTQGDANESPDMRPVKETQIMGRVMFHIPYLGYIIEIARTPWGFMALIVLPVLIIVGDETKKIYREIVRLRQNQSPDNDL